MTASISFFSGLEVYLVYFYETLYNSAHHSELLNVDQIKLSSPGLLWAYLFNNTKTKIKKKKRKELKTKFDNESQRLRLNLAAGWK